MLSRQITWAIAMIEGTREGMRIEPRRPWTRALLAIARAIAWLEELGAADRRCARCGFYMRPHRDVYGYQCLLCGSRMPPGCGEA